MKPSIRSEKNAKAEVPVHLGHGSWQAGPTSSKEPSSVRSPVTRNHDIQNRWKGGCSGWWRGALGGWSPTLSIPTTLTAALEPTPQAPRLWVLPSRNLHTVGSVSFTLAANPQGWRSTGLPETEGGERCLQWELPRHAAPGRSQHPDNSELTSGLHPCPVRSLQSQAPPQPMRGSLPSSRQTGTHTEWQTQTMPGTATSLRAALWKREGLVQCVQTTELTAGHVHNQNRSHQDVQHH